MKCESCREIMLAYVKGELDEDRRAQFEEHIQQCVHCAGELEGARKVLGLVEAADQPPVWATLDELIQEGLQSRASDIHLEPTPEGTRVRYRIDGVLHEAKKLPASVHEALMTRIKLLADMNVTEKRAPQDGRILLEWSGRQLDLRVSVVPTATGERAVFRVLDRSQMSISLDRMGLQPEDRSLLEPLLHRPHGLIMVTGPTGSGKTTFLYALLNHLNTPGINIMTVEDPVEFLIDGLSQVSVDARQGLTFSRAMRSLLRQDPDVILCGEIRDLETAELTVQAALTGHLALSTLHTRDAVCGLRRLTDIGVERFLIADSLLAITAQRLTRCLCKACRREQETGADDRAWFEQAGSLEVPASVWVPVGCDECRHTGYRGRTGVYEILVLDEELKRLITSDAELSAVEALAYARMRPLRHDLARKCTEGITSVAEATRVMTYTQ